MGPQHMVTTDLASFYDVQLVLPMMAIKKAVQGTAI